MCLNDGGLIPKKSVCFYPSMCGVQKSDESSDDNMDSVVQMFEYSWTAHDVMTASKRALTVDKGRETSISVHQIKTGHD